MFRRRKNEGIARSEKRSKGCDDEEGWWWYYFLGLSDWPTLRRSFTKTVFLLWAFARVSFVILHPCFSSGAALGRYTTPSHSLAFALHNIALSRQTTSPTPFPINTDQPSDPFDLLYAKRINIVIFSTCTCLGVFSSL
jgi:hypothetical protein